MIGTQKKIRVATKDTVIASHLQDCKRLLWRGEKALAFNALWRAVEVAGARRKETSTPDNFEILHAWWAYPHDRVFSTKQLLVHMIYHSKSYYHSVRRYFVGFKKHSSRTASAAAAVAVVENGVGDHWLDVVETSSWERHKQYDEELLSGTRAFLGGAELLSVTSDQGQAFIRSLHMARVVRMFRRTDAAQSPTLPVEEFDEEPAAVHQTQIDAVKLLGQKCSGANSNDLSRALESCELTNLFSDINDVERDYPEFVCDKCGACCKVPFFGPELTHCDAKREPRLLSIAGYDEEFGFQSLNSPPRGCSLCRPDNTCEIYPTRPNGCVELKAGSVECQLCRIVLRLPPLEPVSRSTPSLNPKNDHE